MRIIKVAKVAKSQSRKSRKVAKVAKVRRNKKTMINFKITKKEKILEVCNDMCHNYYFLMHGRIYNESKTKYKKFKYIEWFDIFDIMDFFEKDFVSKNDILEYLNNLENPYLTSIKNFDDTKNIESFYNYCNETIINYNKLLK